MRMIQWNFYFFSLIFSQFYPHNFHIWWFHLFSFNRIPVLWCYCHNTIKKLWIRPSIEEIWAKNEVNNWPPAPEKHLLSTLLSSVSPHLKVRRLWMLFYRFLNPWYSIRTFIENPKLPSLIWALTSSTLPSILVWSTIYLKCAQNEGKFKQFFQWKFNRYMAFIYPQKDLNLMF